MNTRFPRQLIHEEQNGNLRGGDLYQVLRRFIKGSAFREFEITRVEAGSNTSTVTLRVVGGDEKGSHKSETVKYGLKSQEIGRAHV
jgi:hypothetical protein